MIFVCCLYFFTPKPYICESSMIVIFCMLWLSLFKQYPFKKFSLIHFGSINKPLTMEIFLLIFSLHFKTPPPSLLYRGGAKLVLSWLSMEQLQLHILFPPFFLFCLILYSMHFVVHKMKFSTSVHTMKQPNCTDELH